MEQARDSTMVEELNLDRADQQVRLGVPKGTESIAWGKVSDSERHPTSSRTKRCDPEGCRRGATRERAPRPAPNLYTKSNRSRFITLSHAAAKSIMNIS